MPLYRRWSLWLMLSLLGMAAAAAVFWGKSLLGPKGPRWVLASVTRGDLVQTVSCTGTLQPLVLSPVGAQVSGIVWKLHADFNSTVRRGQPLVELDPALFDAAVKREEANVAAAQATAIRLRADAQNAALIAKRARELADQHYIAQAERDTAVAQADATRAAVQGAEAGIRVAQAALDRARLDQKNAIIRSPVDGVVIARNVELGQGVVSSFQASNLFSIAEDLHKMQVLANIDEADIGFVKVGSVADFTVDAFRGQHHKARVEQIRNAPQTAQSVVTYVVVLSVENPDLTLRPGMTANVRLEVARRQNALLLPSAALRFKPRVDDQSTADARRSDPAEPDKRGPASERRKGRPAATDGAAVPARSDEPATPGLAYLPGEGRAMAQRIVVGITDGTLVEIKEGLSEGQQVIVDVVRPSGSATSGRPSSPGGGGGGGGMRRGGM